MFNNNTKSVTVLVNNHKQYAWKRRNSFRVSSSTLLKSIDFYCIAYFGSKCIIKKFGIIHFFFFLIIVLNTNMILVQFAQLLLNFDP